ncbi:VanW family protein, partial [Patescibacteria group bacterium]|nr:VanW family protein [Patescibacteria group bacterium]
MKNKKPKNLFWALFLGLAVVFLTTIIFSLILALFYQNRFYPRTKISGVEVGARTKEEAIKILEEKDNDYLKNGSLALVFLDKEQKISPQDIALSFDAQKSIDSVFGQTHQNFILSPLKSLFLKNEWGQTAKIDEAKTAEIINQLSKAELIPAKDASLEIIDNSIVFSEAGSGQGPDLELTLNLIKDKISSLESGEIKIEKVELQPNISDLDLAQAYFKTSFLLQNKGFDLKKDGKTIYSVNARNLKEWLKFSKKSYANFEDTGVFKGRVAGVSISIRDKLGVFVLPQLLRTKETLEANLDATKISNFVKLLASRINQEPEDAKLSIINNAVVIIKKESYGRELDQNKLLEEINMRLNSSSETDIELKVLPLIPEIRSNNISELGIKEKIAVGESIFAGSPKNRINNLTIGTAKFNDVIIKPDEVASFAKIVGSVEPQDGYLPELVIKGTKTIQEYGGGMCQVSTTFYRAALLAGVPIIERRPHAYLVGYYKDGPDATVYVPSTDLKFKNDTGHYILIQTKVDPTNKKMTFEFWGTNDGRQVAVSSPTFSDPVPAPTEPYYVDDPSYPTGYLVEEE